MTDTIRLHWGVSLSVLAFSLLASTSVFAQTCVTPPTCATLGFTKTTADCSGKSILKCPFDQTKLYCPGSEGGSDSSGKTYKVGDAYNLNGVGCGIVITVDSTGQHGTVISTGAYSGSSPSEVSNTCYGKTHCGLDWGIASGHDILLSKKGNNSYYWTSDGCSQVGYSSQSTYSVSYCEDHFSKPTSGYCVASF